MLSKMRYLTQLLLKFHLMSMYLVKLNFRITQHISYSHFSVILNLIARCMLKMSLHDFLIMKVVTITSWSREGEKS